jgi:hypothetical protein
MSDTDPTPLTPVTIGDRLGWFRGDIDARFGALATQLANQHTELLAKLDTIAGGVTLAQLRAAIQAGAGTSAADLATIASAATSIDAQSTQIRVAIGDLFGDPYGYSVKQLLAQIEKDIAGDLSSLNADTGACAGSWQYLERVAIWTNVGTGAQINGADYDIYAPNLAAGGPYIIPGDLPFVVNGRSDFFDTNPAGSMQVCGSWNFTGRADTPSVILVLGNDALGAWPNGIDPTIGAAITGGIAHTLEGSLEIMGYRIAIPYGAPAPELNFWWHYSGFIPV